MKKVILTIDVEGHKGKDPIEKLIWGKINGKMYGIPYIMDICDRYEIEGIFFVDFAEAWDYGKEKIRDVVKYIVQRGHKVGVHLHPDHMKDKKRFFLWEYTYNEQYEMIKKCSDLYAEILGERPKIFRAGKYGANIETLDILNELGYIADFSQFYGQKWCGIYPTVAYNVIQKYKNILEIPVTTYESFSIGRFKRYDKIDATMDFMTYKYVMKTIAKSHKDIVVSLFYHSFSMLDWRKRPNDPVFLESEKEKLEATIEYIKNNLDFTFVKLDNLLEEYITKNIEVESKETVLKISNNKILSIVFLFKLIWKIRKENEKIKKIKKVVIFFLILLVIILIDSML